MPNLVTHTLFCEEVLKRLDNPMLDARKSLFITGGQGPDFLFFNHASWHKAVLPSPLRKYGILLHHEKINAFYQSALNSIRHEPSPSIRKDMTAYVCGHLCHWALDSVVHPLVYFRTGNCKGRSAWDHHRYESLLDAALLQYFRGLTIEQYDPAQECLDASPVSARALTRIYRPAIETLYGRSIPAHEFYETLQNWKTMQKYFRDPHNRKKAVLMPAEKLLGIENLITGCSIPNVCEDNVDICNLLHTPWKDPVTGRIHTESVLDLYDQALERAERAVRLFVLAVRSTEAEKELLEFLDDRDYDTGLAGQPEQIYFDPCDLSF